MSWLLSWCARPILACFVAILSVGLATPAGFATDKKPKEQREKEDQKKEAEKRAKEAEAAKQREREKAREAEAAKQREKEKAREAERKKEEERKKAEERKKEEERKQAEREKAEREKAAKPDHPKAEKNPPGGDKKPATPDKPKPDPEKIPEPPKPMPPAPPKPAPLVASMLHEVDEDFHFQGEYMGGGWGLQVIAEGGGKFRAKVLPGGLPGAGWTRSAAVEVPGERAGDIVKFGANGYLVEVDGDQAVVRRDDNTLLGTLPKIHRISCTQDLAAPSGATVLFDGSNGDAWNGAKISPEGLLQVGPTTKMTVGDFRLHIEFRTPYMPAARGQARGNSGVYIQQRYEVQVLDSFGLEGKNNEAGGLYQTRQPDVNMCLPPLSWQTYDIWFTAAKFDADKKKIADARITVYHNGEPIHVDVAIPNKTGGGQGENPELRPILLQDHGNPVRFRNIWLVQGHSTPSMPGVCACETASSKAAAPTSSRRRRR